MYSKRHTEGFAFCSLLSALRKYARKAFLKIKHTVSKTAHRSCLEYTILSMTEQRAFSYTEDGRTEPCLNSTLSLEFSWYGTIHSDFPIMLKIAGNLGSGTGNLSVLG